MNDPYPDEAARAYYMREAGEWPELSDIPADLARVGYFIWYVRQVMLEGAHINVEHYAKGLTSHGGADDRGLFIGLRPSCDWLTVCHELAHVVQFQRTGDAPHDQVMWQIQHEITALLPPEWVADDTARTFEQHAELEAAEEETRAFAEFIESQTE